MKKILIFIPVAMFLFGCADNVARDSISTNNQNLASVDKRLTLLERRTNNQNNLDLLNKLNKVQSDLSQIRGSLQNITTTQDKSANNYKLFYQVYTDRVSELSSQLDSLNESIIYLQQEIHDKSRKSRISEHNKTSKAVAKKKIATDVPDDSNK